MQHKLSWLKQAILMIWASPTSLLAMAVGLIGFPFGTRIRKHGKTLEIYGGPITWFLSKTPVEAMAMTLGHVIWGQNEKSLDFCREHELVHVRQYERWGPLFVPLYFFYSFWMWLSGKHPYYDNPFEKEAYGDSHPHYQRDRSEK